ncbi:rRNA N6-adenosine-methyltransferase METTL5-like [Uloborus diversus]|uniref:rRNA N6-adenosine-methyltransferase METTL5-like n=1 Tax=Uloborus diversus TaxID=327109 RepID=UPI002409C6B2|nr:rRNA N6-adenosine-methyltransferase METTL5-like [Uloborus diversus]XP_054715586.1 rRNA N6-adenosine-methyltransferase METTL5-like [Uloborus diversus]XP_054715594.1 rRNA N6-adenosine-methyltransferase METTL5-like [Uloborus diversus]
MKLKHLKSELQKFEVFERPNIALEQYATTADIAADFLNVVKDCGDLDDKLVADLGCGCGVLSIGAALFSAGFVVGFDIDKSALEIALRNKCECDCENIDFIQCDVLSMENTKWHKSFDTVIMNPPFGTKGNKGTDMLFLRTALSLAKHCVYSLHKSVTVPHIEKVCKDWNIKMKCLYKTIFELPQSYDRHKKNSLDIEVHLIRFTFPKMNKR